MKIAPINLPYNIKTLWFDPNGLEIKAADNVVVETARGVELGVAASDLIEVTDEELSELKSPLKAVLRIATEEDLERAREMEEKSREALSVFKELAQETSEDMHPVSVEFLLDGDKAVFYFEAEERIDFRDLVRQLASKFHVRVDMRQIGVRDEARIVGGLGHCGQMVCCKRLGGEFKPVSIRMAKDQDLSLNPQKISGLCGRLMCCLRYENDIYKDFAKRAPKNGSTVQTPSGPGKITEFDVPRDSVVVKVEEEQPVKIPLSAFEEPEEGSRPSVITQEGWDEAHKEEDVIFTSVADIFQTSRFTGNDKLGGSVVHHNESSKEKHPPKKKEAKPAQRSSRKETKQSKPDPKRTPRRRSTKISADGSDVSTVKKTTQTHSKTTTSAKGKQKSTKSSTTLRPGHRSSALSHHEPAESASRQDSNKAANKDGSASQSKNRNRRPRRRKSSNKSSEKQG